jgi:hypothetical protein
VSLVSSSSDTLLTPPPSDEVTEAELAGPLSSQINKLCIDQHVIDGISTSLQQHYGQEDHITAFSGEHRSPSRCKSPEVCASIPAPPNLPKPTSRKRKADLIEDHVSPTADLYRLTKQQQRLSSREVRLRELEEIIKSARKNTLEKVGTSPASVVSTQVSHQGAAISKLNQKLATLASSTPFTSPTDPAENYPLQLRCIQVAQRLRLTLQTMVFHMKEDPNSIISDVNEALRLLQPCLIKCVSRRTNVYLMRSLFSLCQAVTGMCRCRLELSRRAYSRKASNPQKKSKLRRRRQKTSEAGEDNPKTVLRDRNRSNAKSSDEFPTVKVASDTEPKSIASPTNRGFSDPQSERIGI